MREPDWHCHESLTKATSVKREGFGQAARPIQRKEHRSMCPVGSHGNLN